MAAVLVLGHLLLVALFGALAWALGHRLTRSFPFAGAWESAGFALAVGVGLLSLVLTALALLGMFHSATIALAAAAAIIVSRREWATLLATVWREVARYPGRAAVCVLAAAPLAALVALPPTEFDETMYHLPHARLLLEEGGPVFAGWLRFPVTPMANHVLFAAVLPLGASAAHAVQLLFLLGTALLLVGWGQRLGSIAAGVVAAALWLGTPLAVWVGTMAYVDAGLAFFVVASAAALTAWWSESGDRRWLVAAGGLAGLAAATKYHGILLAGLLLAAAVWAAARRRRLLAPVVFLLAALAGGGAWYARNLVLTGNPVHPFLASAFGSSPWSPPERILVVRDDDRVPGSLSARAADAAAGVLSSTAAEVGDDPLGLLRLPVDLALNRRNPDRAAPLSPLLMFLLPFAVAGAVVRREVAVLLALTGAWVVLWWSWPPDLRYLLPAVACLATAEGIGLAAAARRIARSETARRRLVALLALLLAAPGVLYAALIVARHGPPPLGDPDRRAYQQRRVPGLEALDLLQARDPGARVYVLRSARLQWFGSGRILGDTWGPARYEVVESLLDDPAVLRRRLLDLGAEYLLLRDDAAARLGGTSFAEVLRAGGWTVLSIPDGPAAAPPPS